MSLFAGIGGLDRAIDSLGGECIVQVEREPYCLGILRLRWPDVPKVADVVTFPLHKFALLRPGTVELVVGGPPCQPISHAGRRKGAADERWLWGEALRVVAEAKPARVFFENPMGLRTMGLDTVLDGLTELGYGGAWEVVAAADVGAPHLRKRIFIMGIAGRSGWEGPTRPPGNRGVSWPTPSASLGAHAGLVTPTKARLGGTLVEAVSHAIWPTPTASNERPNEGNVRLLRARVLAGDLTEAEAAGMLNGKSVFEAQGKVPALWPTPRESEWEGVGPLGSKSHDYRVARRYLDATVQEAEQRTGALAPDWVEWLMGLPIGWTDSSVTEPGPLHSWEPEPVVARIGSGIPNRAKRIRALGNAVVPAQAVFAWQRLTKRLG